MNNSLYILLIYALSAAIIYKIVEFYVYKMSNDHISMKAMSDMKKFYVLEPSYIYNQNSNNSMIITRTESNSFAVSMHSAYTIIKESLFEKEKPIQNVVNNIERNQNSDSIKNSESVSEHPTVTTPTELKIKKEDHVIVPKKEVLSSYTQIVNSIQLDNQPHEYDVTYISQTSPNRISFIKPIMSRWNGPMSIAFLCTYPSNTTESIEPVKKFEYEKLEQLIKKFNFDTRLTISILVYPDNIYPYNALRNEAIKYVKTSHFYVSDMDLIPSKNIYETFLSLPNSILSDDWLAIIVPAYEYRNRIRHCNTFDGCIRQVMKYLPANIPELYNCTQNMETCRPFRAGQMVHDYHPNCLFNKTETKPAIVRLPCFYSERQEPYVIVKRSSHLPEFDPNFINYGKDKISWIENLRYIGYNFNVLTDTYAIDIPHPKSQFFKEWANILTKQGSASVPANQYYDYFLRQLHQKPSNETTPFCRGKQRVKYTECYPTISKTINNNIHIK